MLNFIFGIVIGVFLVLFGIVIGAASGPNDEFDDIDDDI